MVHLASVPNDSDISQPLVKGLERVKFEHDDDQEGITSVYGTRFAAEELPKHEMPEDQMPKDVAYRLIKDDLSLDGNPMLNLASFVTTYMASHSVQSGSRQLTVGVGRRSREAHGRGTSQKLH